MKNLVVLIKYTVQNAEMKKLFFRVGSICRLEVDVKLITKDV